MVEARRHFEKAAKLEPTLANAHAYLAIVGSAELVQFTTKDPQQTLDGMLADGRRAESLNPENPLAFAGLTSACFFRGDHANAQDYARRAVQFNPSFSTSYFWLRLAQVHSGEYQEGESNIRKAFELSPVDPDLIHFYGVLYFSCLGQGSYEEALEAIDKALHRHPDVGHHLGFRAAVLGHLQRPEAKAALERYLALRPNLKTRDDYRRNFIPNSALADPIIEGLVKAGWEPKD